VCTPKIIIPGQPATIEWSKTYFSTPSLHITVHQGLSWLNNEPACQNLLVSTLFSIVTSNTGQVQITIPIDAPYAGNGQDTFIRVWGGDPNSSSNCLLGPSIPNALFIGN